MLDNPERPAPPMPSPRKEREATVEFEKKAKAILRDVMRAKGVTAKNLAERLNAMGIEISAGGLANKISRGGFSAAFLLQCLHALGSDSAIPAR